MVADEPEDRRSVAVRVSRLGIILTNTLEFGQHIKVTLQAAHRQGREALLLGVMRGQLHPQRARKVWCAFVEPKFGYGIGMWLAGSDEQAMATIDRIQCIGAQRLLGITIPSKYCCRPPNVCILMESGLAPACVLRVQGLLRLWRVALSREPHSLLGKAWELGEEYRTRLGSGGINYAVKEVCDKYTDQGYKWPLPCERKEWKLGIDEVANKVQYEWYRAQVTSRADGRRVEYASIRDAELRASFALEPRAHRHTQQDIAHHVIDTMPATPATFADLPLRPLEVSIITQLRCQMLSCVRTHCGFMTHTMAHTRYTPILLWINRLCVYCAANVVDDNAHFLCTCPLHAAPRAALRLTIDNAFRTAGVQCQWSDYDHSPYTQVQILLGVKDATIELAGAGDGLRAKILRATAKYVRHASTERRR